MYGSAVMPSLITRFRRSPKYVAIFGPTNAFRTVVDVLSNSRNSGETLMEQLTNAFGSKDFKISSACCSWIGFR